MDYSLFVHIFSTMCKTVLVFFHWLLLQPIDASLFIHCGVLFFSMKLSIVLGPSVGNYYPSQYFVVGN